MIKILTVAATLGSAMLLAAAPASAAVTFDLSNSGTYVNSQTRTFSATSNGTTIRVRASAWSILNGTTLSAASLGTYGEGLGVQNTNDGSHTIDNQGSYDFITFQFDQQVELETAKLTPFVVQSGWTPDNDSSVAFGSTGVAWNAALSLSDVSALLPSAYNVSGVGSPFVVNLNPLNKTGNLWAVGAQFSSSDRDDGFKIDKLVVNSVTGAIPEPSTWAMMITGFGLAGAAVRRRRRNLAAFA